MPDGPSTSTDPWRGLGAAPGLCLGCRYARRLVSARSVFLRCDRADEDPRFPRYPSLPVLACAGYEPEITAA